MAKSNKANKTQKAAKVISPFAAFHVIVYDERNYFPWCSSETVNFLRP